MKRVVMLIFCISMLINGYGCFYMVRYDGTYRGRIIDEATGKPIEGVVVLGVWDKEYPTPAGAVTRFYDAKETITDKDGEFEINGVGLRVFTNIVPMRVFIFKASYTYESGTWDSFKMGYLSKDRIKWEGDKPIIPLRKLTLEERKTNLGPPSPPHEAPKEKIKLMLNEINKDRKEQGLVY